MASRTLRPALSPRYRALGTQRRSLVSRTRSSAKPFYSLGKGAVAVLGLSAAAGIATGTLVQQNVFKDDLPSPGSQEDAALIQELNDKIEQEFKVQVLRGKCLGVSKQLKGEEGGWKEVTHDEQQELDTLSRTVSGARGLGVQRLFWNQHQQTLVAVIWFGRSMSGWPGVVHGGMIATQFLQKISLAMALARREGDLPGARTIAGQHAKIDVSQLDLEEPQDLSLSYVKPTIAEDFYVLRVAPKLTLDKDPSDIIPAEPAASHHIWEATLESRESKILVKAKATSTRPVEFVLTPRKAVGQTYDQFKEWMWPSRQSAMQR